MDSKIINKEHKLGVVNREKVQITGVTKVISIEEQQVVLITDVGKITVRGKDLHAGKLDVVAGILEFTGVVNNVSYSDYKTTGQRASGLVGRLFK